MQKIAISKYIIPVIVLITVVFILLNGSLFYEVLASPSFGRQVILDDPFDWINVSDQSRTFKGDSATDIQEVSYFSNGKTLNATLWLFFPFKDHPSKYNTVSYGMSIDADFNNKTGIHGIDYQIEIIWKNETKTWDKMVYEWSSNGAARVLDNKTNYTDFYQKGKYYVLLSSNLDVILSPEKYKVTFYAETKDKNNTLITDVTRWLAIPPLELTISTSPTNLVLKPGEQKIIELKVNSTKGYEPLVNLSAITQDKTNNNLHFNFKKGFNILQLPSYGLATTPMTISAANNASIAPYTLTIFANSSFPPERLLTVSNSPNNTPPSSALFPASTEESQNVISQSTMAITVKEPISAIEKFSDLWNKLAAPFTFIFGIAADRVAPWIYTRLKTKIKSK